MTLPKNVEDAVKRLDTACVDGRVMPSDDAWQTIRAHLVSQEAEIADLISKRDFLLRHYNDAESRVAAANALLRKVYDCGENMHLHEQIRVYLGDPE